MKKQKVPEMSSILMYLFTMHMILCKDKLIFGKKKLPTFKQITLFSSSLYN